MKRSMRLVFSIVILIFSLVLSGCYDKNVLTVREGYMTRYPNVKIGDAFDNFFSDGKWESFKSTENDEVVEFKGKALWDNKPADYKFQFIVKGNSFELHNISVNGNVGNPLLSALIMSKVMNTYESKSDGTKQALPKIEEKKPEPPVVKQEYPTPMVQGLAPQEQISFTGKKVVARSRMVYVTKDPSGNAQHKVDETFYGQTYDHLGESSDGNYYRVYVPDYGGAYIDKKYTKLMDGDAVIGSITVQKNTPLQSRATFRPKYKAGECRGGERYNMLAFICNEDGHWYHIKLPNGSKGFIKSEDAQAKYTFNN